LIIINKENLNLAKIRLRIFYSRSFGVLDIYTVSVLYTET